MTKTMFAWQVSANQRAAPANTRGEDLLWTWGAAVTLRLSL